MIETEDYWLLDNTFIFKPHYNSSIKIYIDLITECSELIFSNYDDINMFIKTKNNFYDKYYKCYKCL